MLKRTMTAVALAALLTACGGEPETDTPPADAGANDAGGQPDAEAPTPPADTAQASTDNNAETETPPQVEEEPAAPNADRGRALFAACGVCHSVREGDNARIGPSLYGVYGRAAGAVEGFAYSAALMESGVTWDDASLDAFLENPQKFMRGNRMAYPGERNAENRAHVIEYMKTLGSEAN